MKRLVPCTADLLQAWDNLTNTDENMFRICRDTNCNRCPERAPENQKYDNEATRTYMALFVTDPIELMRLTADVTECNK